MHRLSNVTFGCDPVIQISMAAAPIFPYITGTGCAMAFATVLHMRSKEDTGSLQGLKLLTFVQLKHNCYARMGEESSVPTEILLSADACAEH